MATAPFGFLVSRLSNPLQVEINALEQKGAARSLAEPNLVALSGETASFLAGGEFPVPEVGATGTPSFGFQPYGVEFCRSRRPCFGRMINLVIKPEVGAGVDPTHTVTVAGTSVPGLIAQGLDHARTARRPELHARRIAAETPTTTMASINCRGLATCRCSARCSARPITRRTRPIS